MSKLTPDEALQGLLDSMAEDVLRDDYPAEYVDEDLRAAGGDPDEIVARLRPQVDELLRRRREHWQQQARARLAERKTMTKPTLQDQLRKAEERLVHDIAQEQLPPEDRAAWMSEYQRVAEDPRWWPLLVNVTRARQDVAAHEERLAKARELLHQHESALDEAVMKRINAMVDAE